MRSANAGVDGSLPTVALTTWQAFVERARLKSDERLLIQAGAGGVGAFAIQLAKHMGAYVVATGGPNSQKFMVELGADRTIDYTRESFESAGPYDVVYGGVCGPLIERGIDALRAGGRYVGLVRVADAQAYGEIGFPPPLAEKAAAGVQPFVKRARARGAEFHGLLTPPDGTQLAENCAHCRHGQDGRCRQPGLWPRWTCFGLRSCGRGVPAVSSSLFPN